MPERVRVLALQLNLRPIGHLVNFNGQNMFFVDPDYYADPQRAVLSQAFFDEDDERTKMLLSSRSGLTYSRTRVPPFFSNLLPEGAYRTRITDQLKVQYDADFDILAAVGQDLPGAITAHLVDEAPRAARAQFSDIAQAQVSLYIGKSAEKFSLAGVQLKFSVLLDRQQRYVLAPTGGEYGDIGNIIVKLPSPSYPNLPENEYSSMRLAQLAGVTTPEFWLDDLNKFHVPGWGGAEGKFFAIRRFDRSEGGRIHIEDFAQVLNFRTEEKYGHTNYETLLRVVYARTREGWTDARQLVRRLVVNILLGNGDAHLKNFSLIYNDPRRPDLAPAYDIVSTVQYLPNDLTMALRMAGELDPTRITLRSFGELGRKAGVVRPERLVREARITVEQAQDLWPKALKDLPTNEFFKQVILDRLRSLPLARRQLVLEDRP